MSRDVAAVVLPSHPGERARTLAVAGSRGWRPVPGMSDHEHGAILEADRPIARPPIHPWTVMAPTVTPRRGWVPALVLATDAAVALVVALIVR